jgi:hypothetical protein
MADTLYEKALRLLGRPMAKAADPDARVDGEAEPTDKKLEGAGEEAAAGGQAGGEGADGGVPGDPGGEDAGAAPGAAPAGDGDGDEAGGGKGDGDGDEGGDFSPDEERQLRKAFGLTDFDKIEEPMKSTDISGQIAQIVGYMQKVDAYMSSLNKNLLELKNNQKSGHADTEMKITMKALEDKVDSVADLLKNLPRTAPAAAQPKAFVKAVDVPVQTPKDQSLTSNDLTALAMSGKMSALEVARLNRQINHQTPA